MKVSAMKRTAQLLLYTSFLLGFMACQTSVSEHSLQVKAPFFDLANYFNQEAQRLQQANPMVLKKIYQNDSLQQKRTRITNWNKELLLFEKSAINDDKYKDQYTVDSSYYDNGRLLIHIEAKDKALYTQVIDIELLEESLVSILILNKVSNPVYETQHILSYSPGLNYSIKKLQKVRFSPQEEYHIEVDFKPYE